MIVFGCLRVLAYLSYLACHFRYLTYLIVFGCLSVLAYLTYLGPVYMEVGDPR